MNKGQKVGEYILEERIGSGGFGEVWRARHAELPGRVVAVKFPTDERAIGPLRREGILQHDLDHPGVVATVDLCLTHEPPYFMMEYVDGESLRARLQRAGAGGLPIDEAASIFDALADVLDHAHGRGIIHYDLKPENVLLGRHGEVKVADFGLGRVRRGAEGTKVHLSGGLASLLTARDALGGTFGYVAPEVRIAIEEQSAKRAGNGSGDDDEEGDAATLTPDPRADVYSLGVVFFEMLTGARPEGLDRPSDLREELPRALDGILARALTADPGRRYSDVADLRAAVRATFAAQSGDVVATPAAGPGAPPPPPFAGKPNDEHGDADALAEERPGALLPQDQEIKERRERLARRGRTHASAHRRRNAIAAIIAGAMLASFLAAPRTIERPPPGPFDPGAPLSPAIQGGLDGAFDALTATMEGDRVLLLPVADLGLDAAGAPGRASAFTAEVKARLLATDPVRFVLTATDDFDLLDAGVRATMAERSETTVAIRVAIDPATAIVHIRRVDLGTGDLLGAAEVPKVTGTGDRGLAAELIDRLETLDRPITLLLLEAEDAERRVQNVHGASLLRRLETALLTELHRRAVGRMARGGARIRIRATRPGIAERLRRAGYRRGDLTGDDAERRSALAKALEADEHTAAVVLTYRAEGSVVSVDVIALHDGASIAAARGPMAVEGYQALLGARQLTYDEQVLTEIDEVVAEEVAIVVREAENALEVDDPARARELLDAAIARGGKLAEAPRLHVVLGAARGALADHVGALDAYATAAALRPESPELGQIYGRAIVAEAARLYRLGKGRAWYENDDEARFREAVDVLERAAGAPSIPATVRREIRDWRKILDREL